MGCRSARSLHKITTQSQWAAPAFRGATRGRGLCTATRPTWICVLRSLQPHGCSCGSCKECPRRGTKGLHTRKEDSPMTDIVPYALPDIKDLLAGRLAASTIAIYRLDIAQYQTFCFEHDLQQFDPQSFVAWRDHLVVNTELSPNTINRMLAAIRRTIKEAASRHMITSGVAYDFSVVESVSVRALRGRLKKHSKTRILPAQMRALCDSPGTATLLGSRDTAMLHTLASSGLRISELVSLTSEQIDQAGEYYTMRITGKTDVEARLAPLSVEAKQHIDAWIKRRSVASDYVFTSFEGRGQGQHEYKDRKSVV